MTLDQVWGTLVIAIARKYPNKQVIGYELSWLPWLVSVILKYSLRLDNLTIHRKDFRNVGTKYGLKFSLLPFPWSNDRSSRKAGE